MTDNPIVKSHQPCPNPDCGSSDAYSERADGSGYCFSCGRNFNNPEAITDVTRRLTSLQVVPMRGHTEATERFYNVKTEVTEDGTPVKRHYDYKTAKKVRVIDGKKFFSEGNIREAGLYGKHLFSAGAGPSITITEGEEDAHSLYQALGGKYPVVSVQSSSSAKADIQRDYEYVNSFSKIVLAFDGDRPGKDAAAACAGLFDFNKVYVVKFTKHKDANAYVLSGESNDLRSLWYNASRFLPEGIVSSWSQFGEILRRERKKSIGTYPIKSLEDMAHGLRGGEVVLITAQEGIGKTEIVRLFEHHLLTTTDYNIGTIHIEEDEERQLRGLASYELKMPCHFADTPATLDEIEAAVRKITKKSDRLHIYTHFGSSDPDALLSRIRFLIAVAECKFLFFDHISMAVSGLMADDERKLLDYMSTKIAQMAHDLDACILMVSHLNDNDQTRGSRNISKVADLHIQLKRDLLSSDPAIRNTTELIVTKNRFGAQTGLAGKLYFDPSTFMLSEVEPALLPPEA